MFGMKMSDLIQTGILAVMGMGMIGGFWAYCEGHFALASSEQATVFHLNQHDVLLNSMHDQLLRLEFATGANKIVLDPVTKLPVSE